MTALVELHPVALGVTMSLSAGLATVLGALPSLFERGIAPRVYNAMLGLAAGVMLAVTVFGLIIPAIDAGGGGLRGSLAAGLGIVLGGVTLDLIDRYSPHQHFLKGFEGGGASSRLRQIWLFIIAITIHNFPEGLAVGVSAGSGDLSSTLTLTLGIAIQNIPEGLAVALSLMGERYSPKQVFQIAALTGLAEPVGGLVGAVAVTLVQPLMPYALAFAGGAMLFVISDEIIPETHKQGTERLSTYMLLAGFILMMLLEELLA